MLHCPVIIRSSAEVENTTDSLPFKTEDIEYAVRQNLDVEHGYVYLSDVYLLCQQSIRNSKLAVVLSKLEQPLTTRNLKTINKIKSML